MVHKNRDTEKIKDLIEIMKDNDLVEIEVKHGDDKILLKRSQPQQPGFTTLPLVNHNLPATPTATPISSSGPTQPQLDRNAQQSRYVEITSPLVGTFYARPGPDTDPYVEVGSPVEPKTVVCILEAMKVMNEIKADTTGTIAEIMVDSGQAVEYGQILFKVKPD